MKKNMLIVLAVLVGSVSFAQQDSTQTRSKSKNDKKSEKRERANTILRHEEEEGDILFRVHSIFGIKLATDGYGITYEKGKFKTPSKTNLLQFEFNEKLSNKEYKTQTRTDIFGNISEAKYGKANNFYQFKAGLGQQYTIGGKANKNGVAVTFIYAGGISVGLLKPYFVDVEKLSNRQRLRVKFTDTIPMGETYIIKGASGVTVGWDELKVVPGVHGKTAFRFDYGRFNETVTAIEAGINAEYYTSPILQMGIGKSYKQQKPFFFNAYVAVNFGRRK